jgi:tripartite-type tricarboxylate transporter receptor subunit TctC
MSSAAATEVFRFAASSLRQLLIGIWNVPRSLVGEERAPPAVTDMLGDHADFMFSDAPFFLEHIKAGKLVPLAVGTPERSPSLPDVPTTADLGYPTIVASNTYSLFGPPKLPSDIVLKLNELALRELRDPEVRAAFSTLAATPAGATPSAFAAQIQTEAKRWLPLVKAADIKAN